MSMNQLGITAIGLMVLLGGHGCSSLWDPFLEYRQPPPAELGASADLAVDCQDVAGNLIKNPSFEAFTAAGAPGGTANNTGYPRSTITGPWDGCCSQMGSGGTQWIVTQKSARCGARSLAVQSTMAEANMLSQGLADQGASVAKVFHFSAYVWVEQIGSGRIAWEVWDGATQTLLSSTEEITVPTDGWLYVVQSGTVPDSGKLQVRISSTGDVQAYVDDLVLLIP